MLMIFSSTLFLFCFLPAVLLVYFAVPEKAKNAVLLVFSLLFYAWGEPVYLFLMLFSIVFNYFCGLALGRFSHRKAVLIASVIVNLGLLFFFKYTDFFIAGIVNPLIPGTLPLLHLALPIGISFYTFQGMSYVIDVYRNDAAPQKNIVSFGTYIALFPQLIAGPIVRYTTIEEQLKNRTITAEGVRSGIICFVIGLSKKVLIANNLGMLWDTVHASGHWSTASAWLGILAFTFQIYFDFSGYSDMAIGLGRLFGFEFDPNFDYPYTAKSITDFWRRWHISLSSWFKEYVYIPLGGNRVSKNRLRLNLLIVWGLTGFWHGASFNFIVWGLYYAVLLIIEKEKLGKWVQSLPSVLQSVYTLVLVMIGWVFFAASDLGDALHYLKAMFGFSGCLIDSDAKYAFRSYFVMLIIAAIAMLPIVKNKLVASRFGRKPLYALIPVLILFALCLIYLAGASYNPFLYFRF